MAVYTSGSIGSFEGDSVSFPWCFICDLRFAFQTFEGMEGS